MAYAPPDLFFLLFFLPFCTLAQNNATVVVGTSLIATGTNTPWLSPFGVFAFGFYHLRDDNLFLLSIWYDQIPDQTIVWYANNGTPVSSGSKVELTADRGLVLRDPQGKELWVSEPIIQAVAYGFMNDSGNFVLMGNTSVTWSSFSYPTDTLLPTQTIGAGGVLFARQSETNFSAGRFLFNLQSDGNLVLNTRNVQTDHLYTPYYATGTSDAIDARNTGYQVVFNETGYMYVLKRNNQRVKVPPYQVLLSTIDDYYYRATLNFDGVFTVYSHPKKFSGNTTWSPVWSIPENICLSLNGSLGSGVCGFNSICRLGVYNRPVCQCPAWYSLLDPEDEYGGCKPNFTQSCEEAQTQDLYGFEELLNTDWPHSNYEQLQPATEEWCTQACLGDCFCAAVVMLGDGCWKKQPPLSDGRSDTSVGAKSFLKFRKFDGALPPGSPLPLLRHKKNQGTLIVVGSVLLGSSFFVNLVLICALCLGFFLVYNRKARNGTSSAKPNLACFTYKELAEATDGFKEELGRGAFGIVYKGVMQTGSRNVVAVKKLDRVVREREKEFKTEVNTIGHTHHKNLVQLLGFCDEGQHRMLVYEFLSNGTLARFLFGDFKPSWNQRTEIALGIARGLVYLHEECSAPIIHCDIKPENILLDDDNNPRIADFGLAKLLMMNQSNIITATVRGTKGYVAPEWFKVNRKLMITTKVDVYSFGVLLLEIISCRRSVLNDEDINGGDHEKSILTDWASDCFHDGKVDALAENDAEALQDLKRLEMFVTVGIWCIQEDPSLRPTMRKVTQMLEGVVEVPLPPYTFYSNS